MLGHTPSIRTRPDGRCAIQRSSGGAGIAPLLGGGRRRGSSVELLGGDGGGEGVGQFVDLFEEVGEDALGFLAAACG
jgi:hypothetical protein